MYGSILFSQRLNFFQTLPAHPDTTRIYTVPLPSSSVTMSQVDAHMLTGMFPVNLGNVTIGQQIDLEEITLATPIHVHTPTTHIGLIYSTSPGQTMTSLDSVIFLQQLWRASITRNVYAQLSPQVKARVKAAFTQRIEATSSATVGWNDFIAGRNLDKGPIGCDLLLGATEVWGVESVSFSGFSVIHVA
ncbi:hypothetical protein AN958_05127 [Leucoagaricus sp. SymC.cos]|nr:hypothetical protein AN958_05127 [Leucoagaricus sp. SymC.cos]